MSRWESEFGLKVLYLHDAAGFRREVCSAVQQIDRIPVLTDQWREALDCVERDPMIVAVLVDQPLRQAAPSFESLANLVRLRAPSVQVVALEASLNRMSRAGGRSPADEAAAMQDRLMREFSLPSARPEPKEAKQIASPPKAAPMKPRSPAFQPKKTARDLQVLRDDLFSQMSQEAFALTYSQNQRSLERLTLLRGAVEALDTLIAANAREP